LVIEPILSLKLIFHPSLRQTEGFVTSIFQLIKLNLKVSDHTTLSRRGRTIRPKISIPQRNNLPLYLIVDSTGLSIDGERPSAGGKKRRGWRKLHISIDNEG